MSPRRCRFCQELFARSRFHPEQTVCSKKACQRRRQAESRHRQLAADAVYREVCRDSARQWRAEHPGYWKQYRQSHPAAVERNRVRQQVRDQTRRLRSLANNNVALDLKSSVAGIWLLGPEGADLANNNLASVQLFIVPGLPRKPPVAESSCQQHRSGLAAALA